KTPWPGPSSGPTPKAGAGAGGPALPMHVQGLRARHGRRAIGDFHGAHDTSDLPRLALNSGSLGGPRQMCSSPRVASRGASAPVLDGRRLQKLALAGAFGHRLDTTS